MSTRGWMTATALIERPTPSAGASGEVALTWQTVASNVPCALQVRGGASVAREPGVVAETEAVAWLPPGTGVRPAAQGGPGDRITIGGLAWRAVRARNLGRTPRLVRVDLRREA